MSNQETLEQVRQRANLALQQSATELQIGTCEGLPWRVEELAALSGNEQFVLQKLDSGLTAFVYQLRATDQSDYALKLARPECLVRNVDGQTSFLNELLCRQRIEFLRGGTPPHLSAITRTHFASLRHGVLLSEWVHGESIRAWDRRKLRQVFATGCELLCAGLFEWDYCPGNLLDDGERIRMFDFGYMYPFDPLRHFNSAGDGDSQPMFHLAERFETRNYFAYLLSIEKEQGIDAALAAFRLEKEVAIEAYCDLRGRLLRKGATQTIADWLQAFITRWQRGLDGDLHPLYLQEGWRSHVLDLDDDLRGQTCTPVTLLRCEWLLHALHQHYADLQSVNAFFWNDAGRTRQQLLETYREHMLAARSHQLGASP
jgi:hypothetical protein